MIKLYLLTKQIHRLILYVTVLLIAFMSVTGLILKYPTLSIHYLPFLDLGLIRYIHNEFSLYFIAVLFVMAVTGIFMYVFPRCV